MEQHQEDYLVGSLNFALFLCSSEYQMFLSWPISSMQRCTV